MAKTPLLICMILMQTASFNHNRKCTRIRGLENNVMWPETTVATLSEPPCVNEHHEFVYRKCSNGKWEDEPLCFYIQETPPNCPEDFLYSEDFMICYKIINQAFPPRCPFEDNLPFSFYRGLMDDNNGPFWLPVTRNLSNDLGFLYWTEASSMYKNYFNENYAYQGSIINKNCLLYYNNSYIEAVSCNGHHLSICAYKPLKLLNSQMCPNLCVQSDFPVKSSCFCYSEYIADSSPKAEFLKLYQNSIYQKITTETCYIGLKKNSDDDYIWTESKLNLDYTYWSPSTIFNSTLIYGASTSEGWILAEEYTFKCVLVEKEKEIVEPKLNLMLEADVQLILSVDNPRGLRMIDSEIVLYCFTDAGSFDLITRYSTLVPYPVDENETKYEFEAFDDGPATYWCEAFKYLDMKRITSNTIFVTPEISQFEFVAILKLGYDQKINPLSQDIIDLLKETLFAKFNSEEVSYKPRIMKILHLDEDIRKIWLNIHLSQTKNIPNADHYEQYLYVKKLLEEYAYQITEHPIEIVKFLSAKFCIATKTELTWSETPINTVAFPKELCLKKDGSRVSRSCLGDFYNGAQWMEVDEDCKIYKKSSYTDDLWLYSYFDSTIEETFKFLEGLQERYFQPVDLFLISIILEKCVINANTVDTERYVDFINNLLETDGDVLKQAQNEFNATDRILKAISATFENYSHSSPRWVFEKENIAVVTLSDDMFSEISGIITTQINGVLFVSTTNDDTTVIDIEEIKNLVSAAWLDKSLREQASNYKITLIIVIIYFKNSFFNNLHDFIVPSQHIFEVIIPKLQPPLLGAVWIFQERTNDKTVCSFWDYNNQPGLWIQDHSSTETDAVQVCTFSRLGHLAFTKDDNANVTEDLIDIFESNSSVSEVMIRLSTVSQQFNTFVPFDVFMIGKILEKVNEDEEVDLNLLATTVNNLHLIEKRTLQKSQVETKATDTILQHVDKIIRNHGYQSRVEIVSDNFMVFISDLKTNNFSGLLLLENNQAQVLEEEFEIEEIVNCENLSSAILLDSELRNQLESDTKIIITVFTSDALFNEKKSRSKHVTKIFGVILPELEEYKGPISVLHKVAQNNYEQDCVHWLFNQTVEGSWFKDQTGQNLFTLTHCQFWHTTHFALLLLDQEKYDTDQILDWITIINCSLSFFGLFCIILTGICFKRWRDNAGNQILLNMVFAMFLQISFFYVASSVNQEDYWLCTSVGITLHYFTISEFCWMLVIAFLQFKRFVYVLGGPPQHILLKSCFVGWVLPLVPISSVFIFDQETYVSNKVGLCYPSGYGLYFGVWLPISLIIAINFILFIYIIYSVSTSKSECGKVGSSETIFQWRLGILLFFMLGLTWIFGFLAELDFGKIFAYLFSLTATLQGFVLFLFFLIFNINTKYLYAQVFKKICNKKI